MSNELYNQINNNQSNMSEQYNTFKNNPMQFLAQRGINIPQQYMNNPKEAVQYLLNSGRMSQQGFNNLSNIARMFRH